LPYAFVHRIIYVMYRYFIENCEWVCRDMWGHLMCR